jgi:hypothetical protein
MSRSYRYSSSLLVFALFATAGPAIAQECLGLSATSRGYFSYGFEGTDGATGEGFTVGVRLGQGALQLQRRTLEPVSVVDDIESVNAQVAWPVTKKLPICVVAGLAWTGYDTDRINSWSTDIEGNVVQSGTAGGPYLRLRVPLGISIGKELKLTKRFSVGGFLNNSLLYDYERFDSAVMDRELKRNGFGVAATGGLSLNYSRLMLRPTFTHFTTLNGKSFDEYNDFPFLSIQLGVRF